MPTSSSTTRTCEGEEARRAIELLYVARRVLKKALHLLAPISGSSRRHGLNGAWGRVTVAACRHPAPSAAVLVS